MILAGCWPLPLTTQPSASWWMSSRRRDLIINNLKDEAFGDVLIKTAWDIAQEVQRFSKIIPTDPKPSPTWSPIEDRVNSTNSGEATTPGLGAETPRGRSATAQQQERLQPGGGCHSHAANPWHCGYSWRGSGIPGLLAQSDIMTEILNDFL